VKGALFFCFFRPREGGDGGVSFSQSSYFFSLAAPTASNTQYPDVKAALMPGLSPKTLALKKSY